jgi:hypothetical protein
MHGTVKEEEEGRRQGDRGKRRGRKHYLALLALSVLMLHFVIALHIHYEQGVWAFT